MKKTEYFVSANHSYNQLKQCTDDAVKKRDTFIEVNINKIGKIENENIIYINGTNNQYVTATIVLSYYEKE